MYESMLAVKPTDNLYTLHSEVWKALHKDKKKQKRDFIFHFQPIDECIAVLVRSGDKTEKCRNAVLPRANKTYQFFIRLNCVVRLSHSEESEKDVGDDAIDAWFEERINNNGFSLDNYQVSRASRLYIRKSGQKVIPSASRTFTGKLTVKNEDLAQQAFLGGIGRHKSFGHGLLVLS